MKKYCRASILAILAIFLASPLSSYGEEKKQAEPPKRTKKEKGIMKYIMSCEGVLITEYNLKDGKELFSIRCEEYPPQYINI